MIFVDHHKWLVESNLLTEEMKNNIAMLAYCLIEDTVEASTDINFENKKVLYRLILPDYLCKSLELMQQYKDGTKIGFFDMRRLRSFLLKKKETDESGLGYELNDIANKFIKTYFNNEWSAKVEFRSAKDYDGKKDIWLHGENNKQVD